MTPSILFATPAYGGMVTAQFLISCLNLRESLYMGDMPHDFLIERNESLITRARNEMTRDFLETSHTHMMWLDADMEFTSRDVVDVWNMQADIGVGVYAMKKRDKQWFAAWKDGALVKDLDQFGDKPIEVDYAGTGFMLITRHVIEMLAAKAESYEGPKGRAPALYMTPIHNDGLESEDYHFCRKAREAGFKIMMHPKVRLGHIGQYRYGA